MARIIVMPDAKHLMEGIKGTILYVEKVAPGGCPGRRGTWWRPPGEFSQVREAVTSCAVAV